MLRKGVLVVSMYSYDTLLVDFGWTRGLLIWTRIFTVALLLNSYWDPQCSSRPEYSLGGHGGHGGRTKLEHRRFVLALYQSSAPYT